jgi:hypothetical protein
MVIRVRMQLLFGRAFSACRHLGLLRLLLLLRVCSLELQQCHPFGTPIAWMHKINFMDA